MAWGKVSFTTATLFKFFLASSTAFEIASVTSFAFPNPCPTILFSSPTTTMAEKLKCLPPFVTLVTLFIATNLSFNSSLPSTKTLISNKN